MDHVLKGKFFYVAPLLSLLGFASISAAVQQDESVSDVVQNPPKRVRNCFISMDFLLVMCMVHASLN